MSDTFEIGAFLTMVLLGGAIASSAWRAVADLPPHRAKEDRKTSMWMWSFVAALPVLAAYPTWLKMIEGVRLGQRVDVLFLFLSFIFFPFLIGHIVGRVARSNKILRFLSKHGFLSSRATTPWQERVIGTPVLKSGIDAYFNDAGVQYIGEVVSVDHDVTQVLIDRISSYDSKDDSWEEMDGTRKALYFPQQGTVLWFATKNDIR